MESVDLKRALRLASVIGAIGGLSPLVAACGIASESAGEPTDDRQSNAVSSVPQELPSTGGTIYGDRSGTTRKEAPSEAEIDGAEEMRRRFEDRARQSEAFGLPERLKPLMAALPKQLHVVSDFYVAGNRACIELSANEGPFPMCDSNGSITFELNDEDQAALGSLESGGSGSELMARFEFDVVRDLDKPGLVAYKAISARLVGETTSVPSFCVSTVQPVSAGQVSGNEELDFAELLEEAGPELPSLEFYGMTRLSGVVPFVWGTVADVDGTNRRNLIVSFEDGQKQAQLVANITGVAVELNSLDPC